MTKPFLIVIMNHGKFGGELLDSAKLIIGDFPDACAIPLLAGMSIEEYYAAAKEVLAAYDGSAVILADLYGGTPCNVAMMLQQQFDVRVLCGVNLPMLLELVNARDENLSLDELLADVLATGKEGICQPARLTAEADEEEADEEEAEMDDAAMAEA